MAVQKTYTTAIIHNLDSIILQPYNHFYNIDSSLESSLQKTTFHPFLPTHKEMFEKNI